MSALEKTTEKIAEARSLLAHPSPRVREAALRGLVLLARSAALPDLVARLGDPAPAVRAAAAKNLLEVTQQSSPRDVPTLQGLLAHGDAGVRRAAEEGLLHAIGVTGPEDMLALRELLGVEAAEVRRAALEALARVAQRDAVADLRDGLADPEAAVRAAAEAALRKLVTGEDLGWLAEWVIAHPLDELGEAANRLLVQLDSELYGPF